MHEPKELQEKSCLKTSRPEIEPDYYRMATVDPDPKSNGNGKLITSSGTCFKSNNAVATEEDESIIIE